eukprot:6193435-Pleurochrysis_carterae.AAC.1
MASRTQLPTSAFGQVMPIVQHPYAVGGSARPPSTTRPPLWAVATRGRRWCARRVGDARRRRSDRT